MTNAIQTQVDSPFYITGGTLSRDALCYVTRRADHRLYQALRHGQFSYVLTSRQMGKSSLMVRTASRLRDEGFGVVVLDLTAIGQNVTAEQWYSGLLAQTGQQLEVIDELEEFWDSHPKLSPMQRWTQAIRQVLLPRYPGPVVIFVDEIDAVRSLPFSTDEFFAAIREFYNRRTEDEELRRLTFCLLGVAAPSDLIRDTRTTPFNIGLRIELHDFTEAEASFLAAGLPQPADAGIELLRRILYWTNGHPYLTQRLCQAVAEEQALTTDDVDHLCRKLFLAYQAQERDDNLLFVRERLLRSEVDLAALLTLYSRVLDCKRTPDNVTNPLITTIRLSGITRTENGVLRVRNPIYQHVFGREWVKENMPDAEQRRQRAAYRRGLLRAAAIAALIIAVVGSLALVATRQRNLARAAEETNRRQLYAAQMNLAAQAWEDAGITRMMDLLNNHVPKLGQEDLRGFEWYHLWELGHGDLRSFRHGDFLVPVKLFPDNRRLVTGGSDHMVRVWDVVTGEQLMVFSGHSDIIWSVAVSPDGRTLASTSADKTAKIWNATTGQEIATLRGHADDMGLVGFSPDGKKLATASSDKTVKIWDVGTWRDVITLRHEADLPLFAFAPDGKTIATACLDGVARLWDATTGTQLRTYRGMAGGPILALVFSPDGATLVTGGGHHWAEFWNVASGKLLPAPGSTSDRPSPPKTIRTSNAVMSLSFSPDGQTLALASYDRTVKIYSTATLEQLSTFKGHDIAVDFVAFSRDGRLLVTGGRDGVAKLWDVGAAQEAELPEKGLGMSLSLAFSPDGCCLVTGGLGNNVSKLWDVHTQQELKSFIGHTGNVLAVAFSPDGKRMATGSDDNTAKLWDVATGREIVTLKGHTGRVENLTFSPDGHLLVTGSWDKTVKLWDAGTGQEMATLAIPFGGKSDTPLSVAFSPDGQLLATGSDDNTVRLWDVTTLSEVITFEQPKWVLAVAFSPDGKRLAAGLVDGQVKLWDLHTREDVLSMKGQVGHVSRLAFFPDGKRLASGGGDNTVKIWDVATGQELISFKHDSQVTALAVTSDGRMIASGGSLIRLRFAGDPKASAELKNERLRSLIADSR